MATELAIPIVRSVWGLKSRVDNWHARGLTVGLVPTMGALHRGHLSLVRSLLEECDRVVVSIFVNPKQFGPNEDFRRYPREEADDAAKLSNAGAHLIYAPEVEDMYPEGFATKIHVERLGDDLEGARRPGHFDGVATVVMKLLIQGGCDAAIFGEKDYQQLQLVRRLVTDLDISTRILASGTVREPDGLAASSRNVYLSKHQRTIAPALYQILSEARDAAKAGEPLRKIEAKSTEALVKAGFDRVDYFAFRDAETLVPADTLDRPLRLLAAGALGTTRLIDNIAVANTDADDDSGKEGDLK